MNTLSVEEVLKKIREVAEDQNYHDRVQILLEDINYLDITEDDDDYYKFDKDINCNDDYIEKLSIALFVKLQYSTDEIVKLVLTDMVDDERIILLCENFNLTSEEYSNS